MPEVRIRTEIVEAALGIQICRSLHGTNSRVPDSPFSDDGSLSIIMLFSAPRRGMAKVEAHITLKNELVAAQIWCGDNMIEEVTRDSQVAGSLAAQSAAAPDDGPGERTR